MNAPTTNTKPANKAILPLVIAGALLLPMMGCGGLLMLGAVGMAINGAETDGPPPTMATMQNSYQPNGYGQPGMYPQGGMYQPTNPYAQGGMPPQVQGQVPSMDSNGEGQAMPTPPQGMGIGAGMGTGPVATGGGDMGGVPTYDARADTPGVNGFSEYIRDQSTLQDNNTGEVVRGVDNTVVQPLVESGTASVVSSDTPATE